VTSLRTFDRHRNAIVDFHNAYVEYLESDDAQLRGRVIGLIPAAQAAMTAAGIQPMMYPPRAVGGPVLTGLANLAFGHEAPGFGLSDIPKSVVDWCQLTAATLNDRILALQRKRRNPLYWVDAALRGLLGIPAYIVSLFVRTTPERISATPIVGP